MRTSLVVENIPSASLETGCPKIPSSRTLGKLDMGAYAEGGQTPYDCSESELSLRLCSATLSQSTHRYRQGPSVSSYRAGAEVGRKPCWNTDMSSSSAQKASPRLSACKFPGRRMDKKTKSKGQRTLIHTFCIYHWASVKKKKHEKEKVACIYNGAPL